MSSTFSPAFFSSFGTAKTGPIPISSGSHPATCKAAKDPERLKPFFSARFAFITTQADAPSENWLALPAAITPPGMRGANLRYAFEVVSARMPSSAARVTSSGDHPAGLFVGAPPAPCHRHDFIVEPAGLSRRGRAQLDLHAVFVLRSFDMS